MTTSGEAKLAGRLGPTDWAVRAKELLNKPTTDLWRRTAREYFHDRIEPRYLEPIRELDRLNRLRGEGFAVVTIQCALIEFLAALRTGENYKLDKPDPKKGEYNDSGRLFRDFLAKEAPFSAVFATTAGDFYRDIRCGLLHEGQSKGGYLIKKKSKSGLIVDLGPPKVLYWTDLQGAIETYLTQYTNDLETVAALQNAFIRKYDHLARTAV
ncbi:hypothetical protein [Mesorhizobium sp. M8A.F.Ca.ET.165.01.1.1]|uniref:hypothetical protein n=1 Tax=Mesorhizobium sp. M8A.F.Ca.ET.165.01.1.1 TaxID=2563960 RepID=UPI0010934786|nr:hypothetical protein [Mesorhizobium sp. M8A.F.Ca.ET.165.01.1.1]TGT44423.1 hypothetical protein EN808_08710 [Mesorhizobium sp. M8A.F.Ca.ET.165.01.1.1]